MAATSNSAIRETSAVRRFDRFPCVRRLRSLAGCLGVLAVLFLLLKPLCGFLEPSHAAHGGSSGVVATGSAHHDEGSGNDDGPCCASVDAGALTAQAQLPWPFPESGKGIALIAAVSFLAAVPRVIRRIQPAHGVPRSVSFHTRSARILR